MRRLSAILFLLGSALAIGLLVWQGLAPVARLLGQAGWALVLLAPAYAAPLLLAAWSWRPLITPAWTPPLPVVVFATWLGQSVNWLLPVAQIGGELVKARVVARTCVPGHAALASVVIDKTMQTVTQVLYALLGLALLTLLYDRHELTLAVLTAGGFLAGGVLAFYRLQRRGLFARLAGLATRLVKREGMADVTSGAGAVDREITAGWQRPGRLVLAFLLGMAFRLAMAGEVWLALMLMGQPVSLSEALILESLSQAVRAAAFAVPAGLGVQEGGFVVIGAALGLPPEIALALAMAKRLRELLVGVPALVVLQWLEGARLLRRLARPR